MLCLTNVQFRVGGEGGAEEETRRSSAVSAKLLKGWITSSPHHLLLSSAEAPSASGLKILQAAAFLLSC